MGEHVKMIDYYRNVEQIIAEIFMSAGFSVQTEQSWGAGYRFDLVATKGSNQLAIEVKASKRKQIPAQIVYDAIPRLLVEIDSRRENFTPVIVVANMVPDILQSRIKEKYGGRVIIIDIQQLLFVVRDNETLRERLVSVLEYSVDDIVPLEPPINLNRMSLQLFSSDYDLLIQKLKDWKPKKANSAEYEVLCCDVLKKIFADDLALWKYQQKSDAGLFRFDLICKIKNGNTREFWDMSERYFNSKYVVFEFKNYRAKVTQKEIFTTVKYLYMKALRGVAILVSVNGTDSHADKAIRGILREEGKLIIALSNEDLIKMLELKRDKLEPSDYLSDKLDELLIDLEK